MPRDSFVYIDAEVLAVTERAVQLDIDGERTWVPKSAIEDGDCVDESDLETTITLGIAEWKANDLGI